MQYRINTFHHNFPSLTLFFDVMTATSLMKDEMNAKDIRSEHVNEPGHLTTLLS